MSTQVQYRRGTNAQNASFTGALAEITVDTTNGTLRVHDGITAGGSNIATVSYVTAQIGALSANSISSGTSNVRVVSSGGNVTTSVGGIANVLVVTSTGANIAGTLNATGNITGNYIFGNGSQLTGIDATSIQNGTSNVRVVSSGGNVTTSVGGTANVLVVTSTGANIAGTLNATGNANVGNLGAATVVATTLTGTLSTAAQTNITSVGTLGSLSVTGNITSGNVSGTRGAFTNIAGTLETAAQTNITSVGTLGSLSVTGNITSGNVSGTRGVFTNLVGTLETASQTNITAVGTIATGTWNATTIATNKGGTGLTSFTTNGAVYATSTSALTTGTLPVASGGTGATTSTGSGAVVLASSPALTTPNIGAATGTSLSVGTGNITGGNLILSGAIEDSAQLDIRTTASNGNIVLTPNGTGVIVAAKDIVNGQANGVGNIGSATTYFNTVFAKATSAQYADLAEMYVADADYAPGTVVEFGGTHEITISTQSHSTAVAGIISTNPSYLMNSAQAGEHVLPVALTGRVPCRVQGPVRKGDVLVSSLTPGVAQRIGANWQPGCILGKSMEVIDSAEIKVIEVAVGRL